LCCFGYESAHDCRSAEGARATWQESRLATSHESESVGDHTSPTVTIMVSVISGPCESRSLRCGAR